MNITELKELHPDLVAQIESEARQGMISATEATAATNLAVSAEQERICSLVSAAFGEESGKKLTAVAAKGLTAEDVTTMGITFAAEAPGSQSDEASRAAILAALQQAAPEGLKGVQPVTGAEADKAAAVNVIAAAGSAKR